MIVYWRVNTFKANHAKMRIDFICVGFQRNCNTFLVVSGCRSFLLIVSSVCHSWGKSLPVFPVFAPSPPPCHRWSDSCMSWILLWSLLSGQYRGRFLTACFSSLVSSFISVFSWSVPCEWGCSAPGLCTRSWTLRWFFTSAVNCCKFVTLYFSLFRASPRNWVCAFSSCRTCPMSPSDSRLMLSHSRRFPWRKRFWLMLCPFRWYWVWGFNGSLIQVFFGRTIRVFGVFIVHDTQRQSAYLWGWWFCFIASCWFEWGRFWWNWRVGRKEILGIFQVCNEWDRRGGSRAVLPQWCPRVSWGGSWWWTGGTADWWFLRPGPFHKGFARSSPGRESLSLSASSTWSIWRRLRRLRSCRKLSLRNLVKWLTDQRL